MKKNTMFLITALILSVTGNAGAEVVLFRDGRPEAAVVVPRKPNHVEQLAAQELSEHLQMATGRAFPVIREPDFRAGEYHSAVYVGNCRATREAGITAGTLDRCQGLVKTVGNNLYLAGRDDNGDLLSSVYDFSGRAAKPMVSAGTLFAVYDFLDRELGSVYLWPGKSGIFVPVRKELRFTSIDRTFKPWSLASYFWIGNHWSDDPRKYWGKTETFTDFEKAQRLWLLRHRFHSTERSVGSGHSFRHHWRELGAVHPDFFQLLPDGKRGPLSGDATGRMVSMCVSNPALWQHIAEDYRKQYKSGARDWERNRLNVGENDSPGLCTCAGCRAWDDPADKRFALHPYWGKGVVPNLQERFVLLRAIDGSGNSVNAPSLTNRYCRFYLAVQEEARKFNPDVNVVGFAYANYADPPGNDIRLNENIIISFVSWPYFPFTTDRMDKARASWDGWRSTGARMLLRPNSTHVGHNMPVFYGRRLGGEFLHAARNGALAVSYDSLTGQWGAQSASLYVMARLNARPDLGVDAALDEYYSAFGPAREAVKEYTEYLEQTSEAVTMEQIMAHTRKLKLASPPSFKNWLQLADTVFSPPFFERGARLLDKAAELAAGDPVAAERVKFLQVGFEHARKTYDVLSVQRKFQGNPTAENRAAFENALAGLWKYRHSIEDRLGTDLDYLAMRERASDWKYQPE